MKKILEQWFLISIVVMLAIGFVLAQPLEPLSNLQLLKWSIVTVTMFVMAWPVELGQIQESISKPVAPILACVLNLVAIPLLVWPLAGLTGPELGPGMLIAAATPSTLASAAVLTRRAGGDDSVAVIVTIITNSTCFLVMPFWIWFQTGNQVESEILIATIYKLLLFVVLPIFAAQLTRLHRPLARWATQSKPQLSRLALFGILAMVLLGAIKMGLRFDAQQTTRFSAGNLLAAVAIILSVHCCVFFSGIKIAQMIGVPREQRLAVGFSGSQKTLMIGLTTAINLGVSIIPIVLYHSMQLLVDAYLAQRIGDRNRDQAEPT